MRNVLCFITGETWWMEASLSKLKSKLFPGMLHSKHPLPAISHLLVFSRIGNQFPGNAPPASTYWASAFQQLAVGQQHSQDGGPQALRDHVTSGFPSLKPAASSEARLISVTQRVSAFPISRANRHRRPDCGSEIRRLELSSCVVRGQSPSVYSWRVLP